jgi:hypothetical protein
VVSVNRNNPPSLINVWTVLGALLVAGCLLLATLLAIGWLRPRQSGEAGFVPADLTVIPPSTATASPAPTATAAGTPSAAAGIGVGAFVQITGTEGAGLRIRSAPGLNSDTVFRGEEAETFKVQDGPKQADGYTWWYLVAPYDTTRAGWAAADFLAVVPPP